MKIRLIDYGLKQQPIRQHYNDAGLDVYVKQFITDAIKRELGEISLVFQPHQTLKLPLGFGIELPDGYVAYIDVRSSMAMQGLHVHRPPIDSGYRGEIHAMVTNLNPYEVRYNINKAIGQLVVQPIILAELAYEYAFGAERGVNGYGSTNKV